MNRPCGSSREVKTSRLVYCARGENHQGPCLFADGNGMHIWLDGYEFASLRAALDAIRELGIHEFMSGDWFEQLRTKLSAIYLPNNPPWRTTEQIVENYKRRHP